MEDNTTIKQKFLSNGTKNLIIAPSIKLFNRFIEKISALFKKEDSNRLEKDELIIEELTYREYLPCLFVYSKNLTTFLSSFKSFGLEERFLKDFSVTFFKPQPNYYGIELFSPTIIAVEKCKYIYNIPLIPTMINFYSLTKTTMKKYLKCSQHSQIFKIIKRISEVKNQSKHVDKKEKEHKPNGLIPITKEILKFVKEKEKTTLENVTNYIIELLNRHKGNNGKQMSLSKTNIQRRVYDSVNVMSSVGVLIKNGNELYDSIDSFRMKRNKKMLTVSLFNCCHMRYMNHINNENENSNIIPYNNNADNCYQRLKIDLASVKEEPIVLNTQNDIISIESSIDDITKPLNSHIDNKFEKDFNNKYSFLNKKTLPSSNILQEYQMEKMQNQEEQTKITSNPFKIEFDQEISYDCDKEDNDNYLNDYIS